MDYYENDPQYGLTPEGAAKLTRVTVHWCDHHAVNILHGPHPDGMPEGVTGRSFIGASPLPVMECAEDLVRQLGEIGVNPDPMRVRPISTTEAVVSDGCSVFLFRQMAGSEAAKIIVEHERYMAAIDEYQAVEETHGTWRQPAGDA